jgi:large subunit ribosomal protein L24
MERKYNKQQKLHVKTGDTVIVISGNSKGKTGVIKQILVEKQRVIVENVNLVTKHLKPNANSPQGSIEKVEGSVHISNVQIFEDGKAVRIGRKLNENGKLQRYSKASGKFV